ncbi:hypothetical protein AB0J83_01280 [Actinoplanes sp. NPDC049596]|uniref:hypothetical protein n=1 Tax=unclassified Actinoplanes TaxID=2626549 RepID=UPI0034344C5F
MVRRAAVLLVILASLTGCRSDEDKEASVQAEIIAAIKPVPGVERWSVDPRAGENGISVDAEVTMTPAPGQAASSLKQVRAALTKPSEVDKVSLKLIVKRGPNEHDGRWYDGTAASGDFDRQAELWGRTIESGDYRRVGAMMQPNRRFLIFLQGWTGDPNSRPAASGAYRRMAELSASAGLVPAQVDLKAEPTEQVSVESDGGGTLTGPVLAATEKLAAIRGVGAVSVVGRDRAPRLRIRVYGALTAQQREQVLGTLRAAGLLGENLELYQGSGNGNRLWPAP